MSEKNELLECQFRSLIGCLSTHEKHHLLNIVRNELEVDISKGTNGFNLDEYFFTTKDRKNQEKDIRVELKRLRSQMRSLKGDVVILKNKLKEII